MDWLERHAWWGLLAFAVVLILFGVLDIVSGPAADRAIALGLTGMTIEELQAASVAAYGLFDFFTRVNGWSLVLVGSLMAAIVLIPFRRNEPWAWWTVWLLPLWATGAAAFYVVAGLAPGQPPPPPLVSGPIVAGLSAAILLVTIRRFFRPAES